MATWGDRCGRKLHRLSGSGSDEVPVVADGARTPANHGPAARRCRSAVARPRADRIWPDRVPGQQRDVPDGGLLARDGERGSRKPYVRDLRDQTQHRCLTSRTGPAPRGIARLQGFRRGAGDEPGAAIRAEYVAAARRIVEVLGEPAAREFLTLMESDDTVRADAFRQLYERGDNDALLDSLHDLEADPLMRGWLVEYMKMQLRWFRYRRDRNGTTPRLPSVPASFLCRSCTHEVTPVSRPLHQRTPPW